VLVGVTSWYLYRWTQAVLRWLWIATDLFLRCRSLFIPERDFLLLLGLLCLVNRVLWLFTIFFLQIMFLQNIRCIIEHVLRSILGVFDGLVSLWSGSSCFRILCICFWASSLFRGVRLRISCLLFFASLRILCDTCVLCALCFFGRSCRLLGILLILCRSRSLLLVHGCWSLLLRLLWVCLSCRLLVFLRFVRISFGFGYRL